MKYYIVAEMTRTNPHYYLYVRYHDSDRLIIHPEECVIRIAHATVFKDRNCALYALNRVQARLTHNILEVYSMVIIECDDDYRNRKVVYERHK